MSVAAGSKQLKPGNPLAANLAQPDTAPALKLASRRLALAGNQLKGVRLSWGFGFAWLLSAGCALHSCSSSALWFGVCISEHNMFVPYREQHFCKTPPEMDSAKTLQRKVREMKGELTYRTYAKKLGLTLTTLTRVLNSPHNATLKTIEKISRAFRVTPSQLLDDLDARHRKK
jgi:hypothetical protein